ncbi:MAG: helix-turn-helix domain-containing protein [Chloroflexota bacterium]
MEREPIGRLIRRLRKSMGLTQGQLAEYAKVPRSWLSLVESGRIEQPDHERLESMARVLRVPPQTLWAGSRVPDGAATRTSTHDRRDRP